MFELWKKLGLQHWGAGGNRELSQVYLVVISKDGYARLYNRGYGLVREVDEHTADKLVGEVSLYIVQEEREYTMAYNFDFKGRAYWLEE